MDEQATERIEAYLAALAPEQRSALEATARRSGGDHRDGATGRGRPSMIIVAGALRLDPGDREVYLASCRSVIESARATEGCLDFHLSADPLDPGRVNVFERWESTAAVEAFRGASGPGSDVRVDLLRGAEVTEYEVSSSQRL